MNKSSWLFLVLLACASFSSFAQNKAATQVRFGNIKVDDPYTTSEKILSKPRLVAEDTSCKVTQFKMVIKAPTTYYGPFTIDGAALKEEQIKIIKNLKNDKFTLFIDEVHVKCDGNEATSNRIVLKCNQEDPGAKK